MEIKLTLSRLSESDVTSLHNFAKISQVNLDELVEIQLLAWLQTQKEKFTDAGSCPSCSLRGVTSQLKGRPILEAESDGLVTIGANTDRSRLAQMLYVICPKCLWWGIPDKK